MGSAQKLADSGHISAEQFQKISIWKKNKLFSLHWELRTILYVGVLLFTGGIGMLIYENIDTIGHQTIIGLIALICAACFYYSFKKGLPYSNAAVENSNPFFDYVLLTGCLLFVSLETYLQYQYSIFGNQYNLATLLPALLFLFIAYLFDHKGILSLGISGLASCIGLTVTPLDLVKGNDFSSPFLIFTAITFALALGGAAFVLSNKLIKQHFTFTYYNFALNIAFVATLAGLFSMDLKFIYLILLLLFAFAGYRYARLEKSIYVLLISILYVYSGVTYFFFWILYKVNTDVWFVGTFYLGIFYFAGTCIGVLKLFQNYKRILHIRE